MFSAVNEDYLGSGWSRGHMAPAGDNKFSTRAMAETFYLSNIVPQNYENNAGFWNRMEMYCRELTERFEDVWVVSGPLTLPQTNDDGKKSVTYQGRTLHSSPAPVWGPPWETVLHELLQRESFLWRGSFPRAAVLHELPWHGSFLRADLQAQTCSSAGFPREPRPSSGASPAPAWGPPRAAEEETQPVKALETSLQTDALDIIAVIAADFGSLGFCLKTKNTKSWKLNEKGKVIGKDDVAVPSHLYKVILARRSRESTEPLVLGAFVVPNDPIGFSHQLAEFQVNIEDLEKMSGLVFFPQVDKTTDVKNICEVDTCKLMGFKEFTLYITARKVQSARTLHRLEKAMSELREAGIEPDEYLLKLHKKKEEELQEKQAAAREGKAG
ncbi:nuclease EXOG, mitochondrial isoform X2 [Buteo buteo]